MSSEPNPDIASFVRAMARQAAAQDHNLALRSDEAATIATEPDQGA